MLVTVASHVIPFSAPHRMHPVSQVFFLVPSAALVFDGVEQLIVGIHQATKHSSAFMTKGASRPDTSRTPFAARNRPIAVFGLLERLPLT
jgi:hypothetical protein